MNPFNVGDAVRLTEGYRIDTFRGDRYLGKSKTVYRTHRVGEVVEVSETRCRIRWTYTKVDPAPSCPNGRIVVHEQPSIRTWIAAKRLTKNPGGAHLFQVEEV